MYKSINTHFRLKIATKHNEFLTFINYQFEKELY